MADKKEPASFRYIDDLYADDEALEMEKELLRMFIGPKRPKPEETDAS